jgi:hypothetical protein
MKWKPIDYELPDKKGKYLVYAPSGDTANPLIQVSYWDGVEFNGVFPIWEVTHWKEIGDPEDASDNS